MAKYVLVVLALAAISADVSAQGLSPLIPDMNQDEGQAPTLEDALLINLMASGMLMTGNTDVLTFNAGAGLQWIGDPHVVSLGAQFGLGRTGDSFGTRTAENLLGLARYDYFATANDALFVGFRVNKNPFATFDPRVQARAGYLRRIVDTDSHRLWGEIGYDYTYDSFDYSLLGLDPTVVAMLPETEQSHSARVFLGYRAGHHGTNRVTFSSGFELLFDFTEDDDLRIAWENTLTAAVSSQFSVSFNFTILHDTQPALNTAKTDTTTHIALNYAWQRQTPDADEPDDAASDAGSHDAGSNDATHSESQTAPSQPSATDTAPADGGAPPSGGTPSTESGTSDAAASESTSDDGSDAPPAGQ